MKILYIGLKYDYGAPERGYSNEHNHFYGTLLKMDNGGHKIVYFPYDEIMREVGRDKMNEKLLEVVDTEKPDLCFFYLFTDEIKKSVIKKITESGKTVTYNWFADDHWRFDNYSKYWAPLFHWVSTTDSQAPEKYRRIGYENVIGSQWACNHYLFKPTGMGLKYDVTFVGQSHSNRKSVVKEIEKSGLDIQYWGAGWPSGRVSPENMIRIFSESKINLSLTQSPGATNLKPPVKVFLNRRADNTYQVRNPKFWHGNFVALFKERRTQIKARSFEIPGSGGLVLTGEADNLRDYYEEGKEIVFFDDTKDLIEKAKYYLEHEKERKYIAEAGYKRTIKDHTYEQRFRDIFNAIGLGQRT